MKNIKKFITLLAIQLFISFIFIVIFQQSFEFRKILIPIHLTIVGLITGAVYIFLGGLVSFKRFREWWGARYVIATLPAAQMVLLLILYLIDYISNILGSHNVTYDVILAYIPELKNLTKLLPFSFAWFSIFLGIFTITIFITYLKLSGLIKKGLEEIFCPDRELSLFRNRGRAIISILIMGVAVGGSSTLLFSRMDIAHRSIWDGEPIVSLFVFFPHFGREDENNEHRINIAKIDRDARRNYMVPANYEKKNVILIIGDSLRADHMGVYGYERSTTPFLTSMIKKGRLKKVKMAVASCPESACGILGTLASKNYRSLSNNYNFLIHDLLWDLGYNVYFLLSGDQTHYENLRWYFGQSINIYFDGNHAEGFSMNDDRVIMEGLNKVPNYEGAPSFFYFHLMSPHFLGDKLEAYNRFQPSKINKDYAAFIKGGHDRTVYVNRYDNGVIQTDAMIEEIFKGLEKKGYLENSIVVITGDHGEGLGERGNFGHDKNLYQEDMNNPFLIYDDVEINYKNLEFATQLDVAPTIIDRLGLPIPQTWEGVSLLNEDKKCCSFHQTRSSPIRAVIYRIEGKIYKYMRWTVKDGEKVREELYELTNDPGERRNLMQVADFYLIRLIREKMTQGFGLTQALGNI